MKQRFFAVDISRCHPHGIPCPTDMEYARVANSVYSIIHDNIRDAEPDELRWMALKTALYMEDIVAELGVWESFVRKNLELFGREVPFYSRPSEYWMNEPNLNDIRFVLWSAAMEGRKCKIINPETPALMEAADRVYDYLFSCFENLSINERLSESIFRSEIFDNFLMQRDLLKWIYLDCWLTRGRMSEDYMEQLEDELSEIYSDADDSQLYYAVECISCFKFKIGPLAMYPKDYLALFLRTRQMDECAEMVESQAFHEISIYKVDTWNREEVCLQDVSEKRLVVKIEYFDDGIETTLSKTSHCVGSYVKYDGSWRVNGITSWGNLDKQFQLLRLENRPEKGMDKTSFDKLTSLAYGEKLLFAKDMEDVRKIYRKAGLGEFLSDLNGEDSDYKDVVIYIDSLEYGICIINNAAKIIKSPYNPYYDPRSVGMNECLSPLVNPDAFPGELVHYLVEKDYLPDAALNSVYGIERGREIVQENKDFIARFFRQNSY